MKMKKCQLTTLMLVLLVRSQLLALDSPHSRVTSDQRLEIRVHHNCRQLFRSPNVDTNLAVVVIDIPTRLFCPGDFLPEESMSHSRCMILAFSVLKRALV